VGAISPIHILIVVIVLLVLFGAKKLPELGKSTGVGIREFKKGLQEIHADVSEEDTKPAEQTSPRPAAVTAATTTEPVAPTEVASTPQ
jgi:sec-independent protein translocase protein TatA